MAIQPIDLQTLFTQLDKIGKNQANQREGLQLQQALQSVQIRKKTEERAQSVNEPQNIGEGVERIKDRQSRRRSDQGFASPSAEEDAEPAEPGNDEGSIFQDPALGNNINVSG